MVFDPKNVSRETSPGLALYHELLLKWSPKINLVAKSTLSTAWNRHIQDSAQVFSLEQGGQGHWLDIGSGGGFPGMVCAILAKEQGFDWEFSFIESDQRKCAFLRTVAREVGVNVVIHAERIEAVPPQTADVLSARALADLSVLLEFADQHLARDGFALFQKGRNWLTEVENARKTWQFEYEAVDSMTEEGSKILKIAQVTHV